jgi:hypothetical protein
MQLADSISLYAAAEIAARDFSEKKRKKLAKTGAALPGGGFPIVNKQDLKNAERAIGRAKNPAAAKAHIAKRAKALGVSVSAKEADDDLDDDNKKEDDSSEVDAFSMHHGFKHHGAKHGHGMHRHTSPSHHGHPGGYGHQFPNKSF